MKTNHRAHTARKLRIWAGLLVVLLLISAEFWMVCRFGHECGQISSPPGTEAPALSDLLAAR
jgi:flagellar biogenesis protein FliO